MVMDTGRCDWLDMLEEAALKRQPLQIHLRDGASISDVVLDVVTEAGEDYAVLDDGARIPVTDIVACRRVVPPAAGYDETPPD